MFALLRRLVPQRRSYKHPLYFSAALPVSFGIMGIYTGYSHNKLLKTQEHLLNAVESEFNRNGAKVQFSVQQVELPSSKYSLNVIKCLPKEPNQETSQKPLVIMHGYAAGGAMFANNLAGLAFSLKRPIYAVDWVGFGASSRPNFKAKGVEETLDWFIQPFEEWRQLEKLEKFDLMGHSLGGYLVGQYCANYGGEKFVDNLILASPAGVPHQPPPDPEKEAQTPFIFKAFRKMWSWGWTPGGFIRKIGGYAGHAMVDKLVTKRFVHGQSIGLLGIGEEYETKGSLVVDYMHQLFAAPGSGEVAFYQLFAPGVFAYRPLIDELPKLKRSNVLFLYGTHDWMSIGSARKTMTLMRDSVHKEAETVDGTHHLYVDSWQTFNEKIVKFVNKFES